MAITELEVEQDYLRRESPDIGRPSSPRRTRDSLFELVNQIHRKDHPAMGYRILSVGTDEKLLETRHALLASSGYDPLSATPEDVYEKLLAGKFDLVILWVMLSEDMKCRIQNKLAPGTRLLVLTTLVWPEELLRMVAEALGSDAQAAPSVRE
jgi:PleD family two-component response regulator